MTSKWRVDQSSTPRRLNLGPAKSSGVRERLASPIVEGGEHTIREMPQALASQKRTRKDVTPRHVAHALPSAIQGANILGMFCQESFAVLSNADTIYIKLERVKKSLSTQIYEMLQAG
ncbi:hypothetical protein Pint_27501 [Pistacia integerrima]|uniref:Uncharacterized protein n=1 Tax=Pistacia integerrima TaxID=434235 RepID=A0ACC0YRK6_9ROSI|nr:hypothetical protein Pint_27501 [Pistacia integerrima]